MIRQSFFQNLWVGRSACNVLHGTGSAVAGVLACLSLFAGPVSVQGSDVPTIGFERPSHLVNEGESVDIKVIKDGDGAASVYFTTYTGVDARGENATPNVDYTHKEGTLHFDSGDTEKTINIATIADSEDEGDDASASESFALKLSLPASASAAAAPPSVTLGGDTYYEFTGVVIKE